MSLIEVRAASKAFGGLMANYQVSFRMAEGEILGLIGPNGAGKTTLFNLIAGYYPVSSGEIYFRGQNITGLKDFQIARLGMARTFQVYVVSGELNILENVMIGAFLKTRSRKAALNRAMEVLSFLGLEGREKEMMNEIPVAAQKRVALATALATRPVLILLDEVGAGLNPLEMEELIRLLQRVNQEMKISLLLTEHVMELVMRLSQRVLVLESGQVIAEGHPQEVIKNEEVIRAYLGEGFLKK
jgi:branched-chain amino acid transport system ATP-binding protein